MEETDEPGKAPRRVRKRRYGELAMKAQSRKDHAGDHQTL